MKTAPDRKVAHIKQTSSEPSRFTLEIDFLGDGSWEPYETITVPANGYRHHEFPAGFSAHWVRVKAERECTATVSFNYQ